MKEFEYKAEGKAATLFNVARAIRLHGVKCSTIELREFAISHGYILLNNNTEVRAEDATFLGKEYIAANTFPDNDSGKPTIKRTLPVNKVPCVILETIFGNVAHIQIPYIREMCWYAAGYANIFTDCGVYTCRMTRETFDEIGEMRIAK